MYPGPWWLALVLCLAAPCGPMQVPASTAHAPVGTSLLAVYHYCHDDAYSVAYQNRSAPPPPVSL